MDEREHPAEPQESVAQPTEPTPPQTGPVGLSFSVRDWRWDVQGTHSDQGDPLVLLILMHDFGTNGFTISPDKCKQLGERLIETANKMQLMVDPRMVQRMDAVLDEYTRNGQRRG